MSINTDETTWQTFKRLWQFIRLYKSGLVVAVIALVINAISDQTKTKRNLKVKQKRTEAKTNKGTLRSNKNE